MNTRRLTSATRIYCVGENGVAHGSRESLEFVFGDDAEGGAGAADGPEEVGVGGCGGGYDGGVGEDDGCFDEGVEGEAVSVRDVAVAATYYVACYPDTRELAM